MHKVFSFGFWNFIASRILRNRITIILILVGITVFLGFQWQHMQFSYTEANLLPDDAPINQQYAEFEDKFGSDGNLIMIASDDPDLFTKDKFEAWTQLADSLASFPEIQAVLGVHNLQTLQKQEDPKRFELESILNLDSLTDKKLRIYNESLFNDYPFYDGLLFNSENQTVQTVAYMRDSIVNAKGRKIFILEKVIP